MAIKNLKQFALIKTIIILVIFIAVHALLIINIQKSWAKIVGLKNELANKTTLAQISSSLPSVKKNVENKITELTRNREEIFKKFFNNDEEILKHINRSAEAANVSVKSLEPQDKIKIMSGDKNTTLSELPVKIKLNCDFKQLLIFLAQIENPQKYIRIEEINILNNSQDTWNHSVQLLLKAPLANETRL